MKKYIFILFLCLASSQLFAQEDEFKKVGFSGLGRGTIFNTGFGGEIANSDTVTAQSLTDGEFLLDLGIDITPNDENEVHAILRLRNEFGGFYGAGMTTEIRELWAKGIISDAIKYHVGDMDLVMTPFTLYNNDEDGTVYEPEIFQAQKDIIEYENFYKDEGEYALSAPINERDYIRTQHHTRRMQGAKVGFGLDFTSVLKDMDVQAFFTRISPTDFFTVPSRLVSGGHINLNTRQLDGAKTKANLSLNAIHIWDDLTSGNAVNGLRNTVLSAGYRIQALSKYNSSNGQTLKIGIEGETGISNTQFNQDSVVTFDIDDGFFKGGVYVETMGKKLKLKGMISYSDVGPDFFSSGAQSKRVDFNRPRTFYNRLGNDRAVRPVSLFDLSRDRSLYTFQLSDQLMAYDPRLSNTFPYGMATPNRRGVLVLVNLQNVKSTPVNSAGNISQVMAYTPGQVWGTTLEAAVMSEIRGQGTFELKDFFYLRATGFYSFKEMLKSKRELKLTLGLQYESTQREGEPVEQIDLTSLLADIGIEAELFTNFDLLLGAKLLSSQGNEYLPEIGQFNVVEDFPEAFIADDTETLLGAGIRYRFTDKIYLTLQYNGFSYQRATTPLNDYTLDQFFILYNMNF